MRKAHKRKWIDPVKNIAPRAETLGVKGDLQQFKDLMRRIIEKRPKPSASRVPDVS